ncbi:DotG/IcmE/VirB10 family protein (plasmid) [Aeromonas hydrophila]|uniref:DotG/IcmE/VirB10 family protein n=1 Tax=Aeromonas hydrophila TaxID=644 RepID=UPI002ED186B6|nr:DotG/IcmE/VirB10 family protein [Aeromonas hydrophila]
MMDSIKNTAAVQDFVQLPGKSKKIAVISIAGLLFLVGYMLYSIFAPVETAVVNDPNAVQVGDAANLRAQVVGAPKGGEQNNVNNPQLRPALEQSESDRKQDSTKNGAGTYVVDAGLKSWESDRQSALLTDSEIKPPPVDKTKAGKPAGSPPPRTDVNPRQQYLSLTDEQMAKYRQSKIAAMEQAYVSFRVASDRGESTSVSGTWVKPKDESKTVGASGERQAVQIANTGPTGGFVPGDTFIAFTESEVNSDTTTVIMSEIGSGPLAGAKVPLKVTRVDGYVVFETLNLSWKRNSAPFKAIALDPGVVASNGFSTSTDRHILLRYGMLFASSFAEGAGELAQSAINNVTVNGETVTTQSDAETKDYIIAGVGKVGQRVATVAERVFDTPPTVRVKKGQEMALVVIEPAQIPWLPAPYVINR